MNIEHATAQGFQQTAYFHIYKERSLEVGEFSMLEKPQSDCLE